MKTPLLKKSKTERLHDLRTVYFDFKCILELLKSGSQTTSELVILLESDQASGVLSQLEKALSFLQTEIKFLENENLTTP